MEYQFKEPPEVGYVHERFGCSYELLEVRPYGVDRHILVWRGACADCNAPFVTTGAMECRALNRRCDEHKNPRKPVNAAARAAYEEGQLRSKATQARNRAERKGQTPVNTVKAEPGEIHGLQRVRGYLRGALRLTDGSDAAFLITPGGVLQVKGGDAAKQEVEAARSRIEAAALFL